MKIWSKGIESNDLINEFTVGLDAQLDYFLAKYDVEGSLAHIAMLESIGLLTNDEYNILRSGLEDIARMIEAGEFKIEDGVEDVHSQVEFILTQRFGDVGKKIHSGRSRNDQVLVDLKLFFRNEMKSLALDVRRLFDRLIALSNEHKDVMMPGYTHLQIAMPSSFGLWFGAYAESFVDDMHMIEAAYRIANQNPLGSAAGYGSSFPLNRTMTTQLLHFDTMHFNVVGAQMSRGKTERAVAMAMASVASTLGHFAMDVCMWMCQNFGFVSFPAELTTGSSIMPHKKNPDVFEIMRGKCNRIQSIPNEIMMLTANLPLGYNRDLQLMKDILFPATITLHDCLQMCDYMLQHIIINRDILKDKKYEYLFTVEDVNEMVLSGVPFREAYRRIGVSVNEGTYHHEGTAVSHTHEGSIGNLCNDKIVEKMDSAMNWLK